MEMFNNEDPYLLESNLIPCPFCGNSGHGRKDGVILNNSYMYWPKDGAESECVYDYWNVVCVKCGSQTKQFNSAKEASEAWNKRSHHD
jgi:hypothetical protein